MSKETDLSKKREIETIWAIGSLVYDIAKEEFPKKIKIK